MCVCFLLVFVFVPSRLLIVPLCCRFAVVLMLLKAQPGGGIQCDNSPGVGYKAPPYFLSDEYKSCRGSACQWQFHRHEFGDWAGRRQWINRSRIPSAAET